MEIERVEEVIDTKVIVIVGITEARAKVGADIIIATPYIS